MVGRFTRILVVDDSSLQRRIVRGLLHTLGFDNVDEAANGVAALGLLQAHTYRLVVSDWDMAPMSGLDLLQRMRADGRWRRTPFIMMTAQAQRKFAEIARDDGATHYIAKPFTAPMLAERIARVDKLCSA